MGKTKAIETLEEQQEVLLNGIIPSSLKDGKQNFLLFFESLNRFSLAHLSPPG